jgi:ABC-type Fe3+/spermidine/putrescine transport system ATPase subunit
LYDKPANSFVAEFVGSFNPLPDGISGIRAGRVRVLADDETAPSDQRTVAATVRTAVFAGGGYELGCDVAGVDRLWIVTHRHTYSPGAEVHLAFASEDVIILAS